MIEDIRNENLVVKMENYLIKVVMSLWWDSISVFKICLEFNLMVDDLEIVSKCIELIVRKCNVDFYVV